MSAENNLGRRDVLKILGAGIFSSIFPPQFSSLLEQNPHSLEKIMSIEDGAGKLVELIREVCRLQTPLWQQVPAWALEVDGRQGYSAHLQHAYANKLWELNSPINRGLGRSGFCIDLDSGELVNDIIRYGEKKNSQYHQAPQEFVLLLALDMGQIDATHVIADLQKNASEIPSYTNPKGEQIPFYDPREQEQWRAELRQKFGLKKPT